MIDTQTRRMPRPLGATKTSPRTIYELYLRFKNSTHESLQEAYPWATSFVLGYPLPSWQREFEWNMEQQTRFITSIWVHVDIGTYLINDICEYISIDSPITQVNSEVLLDGQQRLTTIERYFKNEIAIPDREGVQCFWDDLSATEKRFFGNTSFSRATVSSYDEAMLRTMYDLRNQGGTAHKESDRASPTLDLNIH
jgi:hypothetical protein